MRKHVIREPQTWRGWLSFGRHDGYNYKLDTHLEVVWGKRAKNHFGFKLHFGNLGSETPIDWNVGLYFIAFFGSFSSDWLRKFAQWIGRGHKRDVSLQVFGGQLWWKLWYDDDMGYDNHHRCDKWRSLWWWPFKKRKYRSWACWRDGNIDLNPIDAIWGRAIYTYELIEERPEEIFGVYQFDGDVYEVDFKLMHQFRHRVEGPSWVRKKKDLGYIAEWDCETGIPFRNHEWKGDCVYASSVGISDPGVGWIGEAHRKLQDHVRKDRQRNDYRFPRTDQDKLIDQKLREMMEENEQPTDDKHLQLDNIRLESISLDAQPNAFGETVHIMKNDQEESVIEMETGFIDKIDGEEVTLEQINENRAKDGLPPLPKEG